MNCTYFYEYLFSNNLNCFNARGFGFEGLKVLGFGFEGFRFEGFGFLVGSVGVDDFTGNPSRVGEESHDRQGGDGLAGAGFAHEAECFAGVNLQRHVFHNLNRPAFGGERNA